MLAANKGGFMAFKIDENGNITLIQGDSGTLLVNGINTDKNYTIYLAIQDKNRNPIGSELYVSSNKASSVVFELTGDYTDLMKVPKNATSEVYFYGIKQCSDDGLESTFLIGSDDIGYQNTITVFPKKVEGV